MLEDLRLWALPLLGGISLVWQVISALRKNAVRKEDLAKFATVDDLAGASDALQDQITDGDKETTRSHHRIELLEQKVKSLPDFEDINRLRETVSQLDRNVATLTSEVKNVDQNLERTSNAVDRIEQHLLGKAA